MKAAGTAAGKPGYKVLEEEKPSREREDRRGYPDPDRDLQRRPVIKIVPYTEGGTVTTAEFKIRFYDRNELQ